MKKPFVIAIILAAVLSGAIGYMAARNSSRDAGTDKLTNAPVASLKQYSFDRIGIRFSAPADMEVTGDESQEDVFIMTVQRGNFPGSDYYQLYGILQTTTEPTFDAESAKSGLATGAKITTIGGAPAVQGRHDGERDNYVTIIFTNRGLLRLTTAPPTAENEALTNSILDTLTFNLADNADVPSQAIAPTIQEILAKKYGRPSSEVRVAVVKEAPGFASGSVSFGQGVAGGGAWLAVNADGAWRLVFDGNGSVDCNAMRREYGFPDIILKPDFCDSKEFAVESAVRAFVAEESGVAEDLVIVIANYQRDWSDSCLGLGGPAESCLAETTPGYEITVRVNGQERKYRTNADASEIRREQ